MWPRGAAGAAAAGFEAWFSRALSGPSGGRYARPAIASDSSDLLSASERGPRGPGLAESRGSFLLWVGLLAYASVYAVWRLSTRTPHAGLSLVNRVAFLAPPLLTAALAWLAARASRSDRGTRRAWALLGAAFASIGVGSLLWTFEPGRRPDEFAFADAAWLLYYPLLLAGILSFPRAERSPEERQQLVIDAAAVVCGGAMALLFFTQTAAAGAPGGQGVALSLAYPLGDLGLLFGVSLLALQRRDEPARLAYALLTLAMLVEFGADVAYGAQVLTGSDPYSPLADCSYMAAWCLQGSAALVHIRGARATGRVAGDLRSGMSLLPYGFALLGFVALFLSLGNASVAIVRWLAGGATLLAALALLGQWLTARENLRLQSQAATRRTEARFRTLVQNSSDVLAIVDEHHRLRYVAPSAERALRRAVDGLLGRPLVELVHPDDVAKTSLFLSHAALDLGVSGPAELRLAAADSGWLPMEAIATNLFSDPDIAGIVLTLRNVSDRKMLEEQLMHRALHDSLTGLANRALFGDRLRHAHHMSQRSGTRYAVLVADFDGFKAVNDALGHATGDQLLVEAARRLRAAVRDTDTPARLGGDEFAVLLEGIGEEAAACRVAAAVLEAWGMDYELPSRSLRLTACLGVAMSSDGAAEEEVLRRADLALYHAKDLGKGRFALFAPGMDSEMLRRHRLEAELRDAIERRDFLLLFQPIVSLRSGQAIGAEALLRWRRSTDSLVSPSDFIDLAEESGLIEPLGKWVIDAACSQGARWNRTRDERFHVGVNLSVRQLLDPEIVGHVRSALAEHSLPPECLVLEITESLLASDPLATAARLHELKALGVRLALDDFGTGYSSLGRLRELPIDILKIDSAFCRDLGSPQGQSLARAIVVLAKAIDLHVVGEGVEEPGQERILRDIGCDYGQGFHFGRPVPAGEISAPGRVGVQSSGGPC